MILVTGGKGGVGKTTVAVNLALALAAESVDPLLVDLDFALGDVSSILGVRPAHDLGAFFRHERSLAECVVPSEHGLRVLFSGSGSPELARPDAERRHRLLREIESGVDRPAVVIGDSPAGIGPDVLDFGARSSRVLVVTTPEPAAVTDAFGVVKALDAHARETGREIPTPEILVNFADDRESALAVARKLAQVCERFLSRAPRCVGWLPRSRAVLASTIEETPFVLARPRSLAARNMQRLAAHFRPFPQPGTGVSAPAKAPSLNVR